jgi:hypothetical protein
MTFVQTNRVITRHDVSSSDYRTLERIGMEVENGAEEWIDAIHWVEIAKRFNKEGASGIEWTAQDCIDILYN